jgi:hypothetical protein
MIKDKIIIFTAEHNGFGPVSKMCNIAMLFSGYKKFFIGREIALEYVKNSPIKFDKKINSKESSIKEIRKILRKADFVINVMNQEIAFLAYQEGIRYYFFDSLFGFWHSEKNDLKLFSEFHDSCVEGKISRTKFDSYSVHEQKLLAHFLSDFSFIQNFFGVEKRFLVLKKYFKNIKLVKPFAIEYVPKKELTMEKGLAVINIGGVRNFLVKNDQSIYFDLIRKLAIRLLLDKKNNLKKIIICSGLYSKHGLVFNKNGRKIIHDFFDNKSFMKIVKKSEIYFSSAGLTTIFESIYMCKPAIYLPEQHSSHYYNISQIKKTLLAKYVISVTDIFKEARISPNDFKGSAQIMNFIKEINENSDYFNALYDLLLKRIVKYRADGLKINFLPLYQKLNKEYISLRDSVELIKNKFYGN